MPSTLADATHAHVYQHGIFAGVLTRHADRSFSFTYDPEYLDNPIAVDVSWTLPRRAAPYTSANLFPFFAGLLAEGAMRVMQARMLRVDETDDFGLLLVAGFDTIGSVTVLDPRHLETSQEPT